MRHRPHRRPPAPTPSSDRRIKLPAKELGPRKGERGSLLCALDIVFNGRVGSERSGKRTEDAIEASDLVHVTNDEKFVRKAACRLVSPDARLVFLDRLLEMFPRLRGLHHLLLDGFTEVASPKGVLLLERIARGKAAPDRARAVLAARGL